MLNTAPAMLQFKPFGVIPNGLSTTTSTTTVVPSLNNTRMTNGHINNSVDFMNGTATTTTNGILRSGSLNKNFNMNNNEGLFEQRQYHQQAPLTTTTANNYGKNLNSSSSSSSSSAAIAVTTAQQQINRLDPKYFQPQTTTAILPDTNPLSIKTRPLSSNTTNNAVRINKQLVQQQQQEQVSPNNQQPMTNGTTNSYSALIAAKSTPSLASAYFPTN